MEVRQVRKRRGFTLIEVIISLTIFTILMAAIATCTQAAFRAQLITERRQEETAVVRAVFGLLTRDLQSASGMKTNAASLFQAGGSGTLLLLTTRTGGIVAPGLEQTSESGNASDSSSSGRSGSQTTSPQSDLVLVRYDYNSATGELSRSVSPVPNTDQFSATSSTGGDPKAMIGKNIVSITLRFWDTATGGWRNVWNFKGQKPPAPAASLGSGGASGTPADGQTDPAQAPPTDTSSSDTSTQDTGGDTALPSSVEIECVVKLESTGTATYKTTVSVTSPQSLAPVPKPVASGIGATAPPTRGRGTGGGGTGGAGAGGG